MATPAFAKLEDLDKQMDSVKSNLIEEKRKIEKEMEVMNGRLFGAWLQAGFSNVFYKIIYLLSSLGSLFDTRADGIV